MCTYLPLICNAGTLKERGLLHLLKELDESTKSASNYEDGLEIYRLPFVSESFRRGKLAKYIPIFGYIGKTDKNWTKLHII